jgi:hypothetical protein
MPRRVDPKKKRRDWRWYASFGLNALVALSMMLGTVIIFVGAPTTGAPPPPTIEVPTLAPSTPTPAPPTPTPQASADYTFAVAGRFNEPPGTAMLFTPSCSSASRAMAMRF